MPVGEPVLGRLLDVTGRVRDNGPATARQRPARRSIGAPPLGDRRPAATIFETGIKVIDLLAPLAARRQSGDVRRRRRRQDRCW